MAKFCKIHLYKSKYKSKNIWINTFITFSLSYFVVHLKQFTVLFIAVRSRVIIFCSTIYNLMPKICVCRRSCNRKFLIMFRKNTALILWYYEKNIFYFLKFFGLILKKPFESNSQQNSVRSWPTRVKQCKEFTHILDDPMIFSNFVCSDILFVHKNQTAVYALFLVCPIIWQHFLSIYLR